MWHIIKAEIEREKATWLGLCIPLILTMPILQFINTASNSELKLRVMTNLTKGFAIVTWVSSSAYRFNSS